jgi:hypothetical protein
MAFGQQSGPPATHRQVQQLLELLNEAGHVDFRDARGPMGFTQRQAGGKFTRDEADAFIAELEVDSAAAEGLVVPAASVPVAAPARAPRQTAAEKLAAGLPDGVLAAELQSRGWVVMEP